MRYYKIAKKYKKYFEELKKTYKDNGPDYNKSWVYASLTLVLTSKFPILKKKEIQFIIYLIEKIITKEKQKEKSKRQKNEKIK